MFDYLVKTFKGNSKNVAAKQIESVVNNFLNTLELDKVKMKVSSSLIVFLINFMNNDFENFPSD